MNTAPHAVNPRHSFAPVAIDKAQKSLETLLENLHKVRVLKDISQEAVGVGIGIDRSGIGKIEAGKVELTMYRFFQFCDFYNISPVGLFTGQFDMVNEKGATYSDVKQQLEESKKNEEYWRGQFAQLSIEHLALQKSKGKKK